MKWPNKQSKLRLDETDPAEELGSPLSPAERVLRVLQEIEGVSASFGVSDWEKKFLEGNKENKFPNFTPKMEAAMQDIEAKVFGDQFSAIDPDEQIDELTGELHFKGKKK